MKTLILHGSPRRNGDSAALLRVLTESLEGDYRIIDTYHAKISPCVDCRFCRTHEGCAIDDEMTPLYHEIEQCDRIVIASPIYFNELTGRMLDVCSRLQMYFSMQRFQNKTIPMRPKCGGVILTGGGAGQPDKPYATAVCLLHHMGVKEIFPLVCSFNTDTLPAAEDTETIEQVQRLASFLNRRM
ncbi:MAG: flavodoxin family protein [Oscillospiraceae bacterium]|nr:flavodoxin family protein [Oscillospiraceae bacterium]